MEWWPLLVIASALAVAVAQWRGWIDLTGKHSSGSGDPFGAIDEIFAPYRHEIQSQRDLERHLAAPSPGTPDTASPPDSTLPEGRYDAPFRLGL